MNERLAGPPRGSVFRALPDARKAAISAATDKFSYDHVGEWGPRGPALFYYLKPVGVTALGYAVTNQRHTLPNPVPRWNQIFA